MTTDPMPDHPYSTGTLTLTRSFAVTPARLWHYLTEASARQAWGAPDDDHVLEIEYADLREGGQERMRCGPKDDPMYQVDTRWYRLEPSVGACYSETLIFGGAACSVSLASYAIAETASGSDLRVDVAITSFTPDAPISEHEAGWTAAIDRLTRIATA